MLCVRRIDGFTGSDAAYVEYLEAQVYWSRHQIHQLKSTLSPVGAAVNPPKGLPDHPSDITTLERSTERLEEQSIPDGKLERKEVKFVHAAIEDVTTRTSRNEKPQWLLELNAMLAGIPHAAAWMAHRAEIGIVSSAQNYYILSILLGRSMILDPSAESIRIPSSSNDLNSLLNAYGRATRNSHIKAKFATMLSRFQALIFASLCVVLEAYGIPIDVIDSEMRSWLDGATEQKSLERIRRGALWANRCIVGLSDEWNFRSAEIFLLCGRPVNFYGRFSDSTKKSFKHFTEQLVHPEYTTPYKELDDWLPYNIPCIIKSLVGDTLTLQEICTSLEYPGSSLATFTSLHDKYERCHRSESEKSTSRSEDKLTLEAYSLTLAQTYPLARHLSDFQQQNKHRRRKAKHRRRKAKYKSGAARDQATKGGNSVHRKTAPGNEETSRRIPKWAPICPGGSHHETRQQNATGRPCRDGSTPMEQSRDTLPAALAQGSLHRAVEVLEAPEPSANGDLPEGTGFDVESMLHMGFDVVMLMEMGFDVSSVMEPGLFPLSPADTILHQDERQPVEDDEMLSRAELLI